MWWWLGPVLGVVVIGGTVLGVMAWLEIRAASGEDSESTS